MSRPVHNLKVLQHWDCHGCAFCCRSYTVWLSDNEYQRLKALDWGSEAELRGQELISCVKPNSRGQRYRLNQRADGSCVFLSSDGRCCIHSRFGESAKPFACRLYPFVLVPAGDRWQVGLRFACPSVAGDNGRSIAEHKPLLESLARDCEQAEQGEAEASPTANLQAGQPISWQDVTRFTNAISRTLADEADPLERRWRRVLGLADLCRNCRFDGRGDPRKAVSGSRLEEFLEIISQAMADETPPAHALNPPGRIARQLFRAVLAILCRKDQGPDRGPAQRHLFGRIYATAKFASGYGRVPQVHAAIPPKARFSDADHRPGLTHEAQRILTRYYQVKVESLQFQGATNFGLFFWDGLASLAMTLPAIAWLTNILAIDGNRSPHEALITALRIIDDNFGFNPLFAGGKQRLIFRFLAHQNGLARLIAYYARLRSEA